MNVRVWGETIRLVGQGNAGKPFLLSVGILICKMRINSPYFMGIEGIEAQCGRSTSENYYHYCYQSGGIHASYSNACQRAERALRRINCYFFECCHGTRINSSLLLKI